MYCCVAVYVSCFQQHPPRGTRVPVATKWPKEIQMNTPRMLPFLANTAGIGLERAETLWHTASDHAQSVTGETDSARFLSIAHEQMVALVEKEVLSVNPVEDAPW